MYVIYLDVLFMINLIMDLVVFSVATMLLNKHIPLRRLVFASIIAALLYCMFMLVPVLQQLPAFIGTLVVPLLPIIILYRPTRVKKLIKQYSVCMGVAALIGGMTFSLWYIFKQDEIIDDISIIWLVGIGIGVWAVVYISFNQIRKRLIIPHFTYNIQLTYHQKKTVCKGLLDTGNCLYTVISHKPVLVVSYPVIKNILSDEQIRMIELAHYNVQKMIDLNGDQQYYLIPFSSVGCKGDLLWGVEMDEVIIRKEGYSVQLNQCVVGVAFQKLFADDACEALVHPDFIMSEGEVL